MGTISYRLKSETIEVKTEEEMNQEDNANSETVKAEQNENCHEMETGLVADEDANATTPDTEILEAKTEAEPVEEMDTCSDTTKNEDSIDQTSEMNNKNQCDTKESAEVNDKKIENSTENDHEENTRVESITEDKSKSAKPLNPLKRKRSRPIKRKRNKQVATQLLNSKAPLTDIVESDASVDTVNTSADISKEDKEYCLTVSNLPNSWSFMEIKNYIDTEVSSKSFF